MQATVNIVRNRDYDVVVCGGGTAGFCAAVAAARCGARTAVIERWGMLGGTMTVGGVPAPALFHAHGRQIIAGIGWELMTALADQGFASLPEPPFDAPHPRLAVQLNPFQAAMMMDEMARQAGVELLFHQTAAAVEAEDGHVKAVLTAGPEGMERNEGRVFIDCSGDGLVSALAGAEFELCDELQPATLNFVLTGFDPDGLTVDEVQKKYAEALRCGALTPSDIWGGGAGVFATGRGRGDGLEKCWALNPGSNLNHVYPLNGANADSRSAGEVQGRREIARVVRWLNDEIPGYERAYVAAVSPEVAARESRRILGNAYMTGDDYIRGVCPADAVCYSFYPIDVHRGDTETMLDNEFHERGRVPGVPYGALVARGFDNLMMAGRIASGDRRAQSAYRVQASCMAMGQAAGTAAAMAATLDGRADAVNVSELRARLAEDGAIVPGIG